MPKEYISILTCAYKGAKDDASLALKFAQFLLSKYHDKKVRLIFAVDDNSGLAGSKKWEKDMLVFCTANNISPDRVTIILRVAGADKLGLGVAAVSDPTVTTKFESTTGKFVDTETEESAARRKAEKDRNLLDPTIDFADSAFIFVYPNGTAFRKVLKKLKIPCAFIGSYSKQTTNRLTATVLSTGLDLTHPLPGIWLGKGQEMSFEIDAYDQKKIAAITHKLENPKVYFADSFSMASHALKHSHVSLETFMLIIVAMTDAASPQDILLYCNLTGEVTESFKANSAFLKKIIQSKKFKQIIIGEKLLYNNTSQNAANLPRLKLADPFPIQPSTFKYLISKSEPLTLVTGTTAIIEALELGKIPFYQCMIWDKSFLDDLIKINRALGFPNTILAEFLAICNGLYATQDYSSLHYVYRSSTTKPEHVTDSAEHITKFVQKNLKDLLSSIPILLKYLHVNFDIAKSLERTLSVLLDPNSSQTEEFYKQIYLQRLKDLRNIEQNIELFQSLEQRYGTGDSHEILTVVLRELKTKSDTELDDLAKMLGKLHSVMIYDELDGIYKVLEEQKFRPATDLKSSS